MAAVLRLFWPPRAPCAQVRAENLCKVVSLSVLSYQVNPGQSSLSGGTQVTRIKMKLYPLAIGVVGLIAANGGYLRAR